MQTLLKNGKTEQKIKSDMHCEDIIKKQKKKNMYRVLSNQRNYNVLKRLSGEYFSEPTNYKLLVPK